MTNVKILIAEDVPHHAQTLINLLDKFGYKSIEHVPTGEKAVVLSSNFKPDLILMDVELAGKINGIEAVKRIQKRMDVPVIYISGKRKEYAEEALGTKLSAFIQKPYNAADLKMNIEIAIRERNLSHPKYAFIKNRNAYDKVKLGEILWIEGNKAYCRIRLKNRSYTLSNPLGECEERLKNTNFLRVHNSFMVNIHSIESIVTINKRRYLSIKGLETIDDELHTLMNQGNDKIPISRTYAPNLKHFFVRL